MLSFPFLLFPCRLLTEFSGLELRAFLKVNVAERRLLCRCEVTGSLSGEPAGGHVGYLGDRDEVVHLLTDGGADL